MCLVVDPATSPAPSIVVDFTEVIIDGGISPPKVKDLVMVFGELILRNLVSLSPPRVPRGIKREKLNRFNLRTQNSNQTPRNELSVLNVLSPRTTRILAAKRLVRIEEGPGTGFDVYEWAQTVKTVESHVAPR